MGGKSDSTTPPPPVEPAPAGMDMGMMMQMFSSMMGSMPQAAVPTIPDAPEVVADPVVDWGERQTALADQARADFEDDTADKRGRASTILTSPFLDEELDKTDSLLG